MLQLIEAAERIRAVAQSTDLPMSAMLDDVAKLLDQADDSGNYCAARIAELEVDRDRLAAIVERARNGDRAGGSATIWSLREQRDNGLVRIAELEADRDRLAAIVERLPRTADWVPVTPGMTLHHPDDITTYGGVIQVDDCITTVLIAVERQPDGLLGRCVEFSAADCYSTRELAEAAAKGDS